jgi:tetratricopeptide (TPR) repeat protein
MYSIPLHPDSLLFGSKRPLIRIFELNVEANPSSYTYDSLGEACMTAGDKECAMKSFRRALALSPNDMNATEGLKKLRRKNLYKFAPKFIFPAVYLQALGSPAQPSQVVEGIGVLFRAGGHTEVVDLPATHHGPAHVTRADREAILARRERFPHADLEDSAFYLHR